MSERKRQALYELARRRARVDLLAFLRWCWWMPGPLKVGRHTRAICDRLTRAVADWREGRSTYLLVAVPFRHGKSDMVSRALPAFFLGSCADLQPDVIMSGYGADLVEGFSRKVKGIMAEKAYQALFPGVKPAHGANRVDGWAVEGSSGSVTAVGLGGAITGKGGHLIIVDDYCKNIEQARSKTFREKVWESFATDLMTRQNAPASIVVVCATPWDVDDVRGRILAKMAEDTDFPRFEELSFPARKSGSDGWDNLFPEHFTPDWYARQRATLGKQAAALLDCNPLPVEGGRFASEKLVLHRTLDDWPVIREQRGWDLASSAAERDGSDPDWTWGVRGGVTKENLGRDCGTIHTLWIRHAVCCREEAAARNALIRKTALSDGGGVGQVIEAFGAYKDAYTQIRDALRGVCSVKASRLPGDKSAKLAALEPVWEAGRVHLYIGPGGMDSATLGRFLEDFASFPNGRHDDACDAAAVLFHACRESTPKILI